MPRIRGRGVATALFFMLKDAKESRLDRGEASA